MVDWAGQRNFLREGGTEDMNWRDITRESFCGSKKLKSVKSKCLLNAMPVGHLTLGQGLGVRKHCLDPF